MHSLVVAAVALLSADTLDEGDIECCTAIKVGGEFFYNSLGARTYGLKGSWYEWDIIEAIPKFYYNDTWGKWVYGYPDEELSPGVAFITHVAAEPANCPNETDWVRIMDLDEQSTNDIFERPVWCVDPTRRIIAYDKGSKQFYGDDGAFEPRGDVDERIYNVERYLQNNPIRNELHDEL